MYEPLTWPGHQEYNMAVQNPQRCFSDSELSNSVLRCDELGRPLAAPGASAIVYRLHAASRALAVRCFVTPASNVQRERYRLLNDYLADMSLPALLDHEFVEQGIRVGERWYPVVKMRWVEGRPMHKYVEQHLYERPALRRLADKWRMLMAELAERHVAHGDLHHDNVLIDHYGHLRLLDYDAMFVPTLQAHDPGERGHPHFHHPHRQDHGYYGENVDSFAGLVIYLSLLAIAIDPELWSFHTGENLIFLDHDFRHPGETDVWRRVQASKSRDVRMLAGALEEWCRETDLRKLPSLEAVLHALTLRPVAERRESSVGSGAKPPLPGARQVTSLPPLETCSPVGRLRVAMAACPRCGETYDRGAGWCTGCLSRH